MKAELLIQPRALGTSLQPDTHMLPPCLLQPPLDQLLANAAALMSRVDSQLPYVPQLGECGEGEGVIRCNRPVVLLSR